MAISVKTAIQQFSDAYLMAAAKAGKEFPRVEFDPEWLSECQKDVVDADGLVGWQPIEQHHPVDFRGLENALELQVHPDVKEYFGSFWSGSLEATCKEGHVSLIQLWNPQDFDRLIENLIGHALAKRRLKQPFTVFFATTEPDSEFFLSIDNETGAVLLEEPGFPPRKTVDACLSDFIKRLTPSLEPSGIH
jgi:SecY interacting protein Syd